MLINVSYYIIINDYLYQSSIKYVNLKTQLLLIYTQEIYEIYQRRVYTFSVARDFGVIIIPNTFI